MCIMLQSSQPQAGLAGLRPSGAALSYKMCVLQHQAIMMVNISATDK